MRRLLSPTALLAIAVLSYGYSNALVRQFSADRFGLELAFWLAAATSVGLLASFGRNARSRMRLGNVRAAAPFITLQGTAFLTFVLAMDLAPTAQVGAILPVEGIVAAGLAALLFKEQLGWIEVLCIAGSAAGAVLLAGASLSISEANLGGLLFALASATLYGCAMLALRRAATTNTISALTFWACIPIVVLCAPFGVPAYGPDMLVLFGISCVAKTIADLSYTGGIARAPIALASSTLPMIGMATSGFAWLLMGERPGAQAALAAAIIAICSVILVLRQSSRSASTPS